ncbi:MAG TPA: hypothetical protein VGZ22_31890 [Isosphaeraceae bacterium]|jgi:hypothetical protein|nr:hypothetical protein [Isosphaeraceae bacterium]
MTAIWKQLDRLLRGEATRPSALQSGTIEVEMSGLTMVILLLGLVYGASMGSFAVFKVQGPSFLQLAASMVKVPALILLTLAVTFPSLYVFNALVGSRLSLVATLRLLIASLAVMQAVLASLGPIVAFFSVSTTSYTFMVLLNVVVFGFSGFLGLSFLLQTLHRLSLVPPKETSLVTVDEDAPAHEPAGALEPIADQVLGRHVKTVFRCWVVVFGLVGAQMGWVLRPFIGEPHSPFVWFRGRESNFFQAVWYALISLLT